MKIALPAILVIIAFCMIAVGVSGMLRLRGVALSNPPNLNGLNLPEIRLVATGLFPSDMTTPIDVATLMTQIQRRLMLLIATGVAGLILACYFASGRNNNQSRSNRLSGVNQT